MKKPMKNKGRSGAGKMAPEITISIRMMPSKMSKSEKKNRAFVPCAHSGPVSRTHGPSRGVQDSC